MDQIPTELVLHFAKHLDLHSFLLLASSCRTFHAALHEALPLLASTSNRWWFWSLNKKNVSEGLSECWCKGYVDAQKENSPRAVDLVRTRGVEGIKDFWSDHGPRDRCCLHNKLKQHLMALEYEDMMMDEEEEAMAVDDWADEDDAAVGGGENDGVDEEGEVISFAGTVISVFWDGKTMQKWPKEIQCAYGMYSHLVQESLRDADPVSDSAAIALFGNDAKMTELCQIVCPKYWKALVTRYQHSRLSHAGPISGLSLPDAMCIFHLLAVKWAKKTLGIHDLAHRYRGQEPTDVIAEGLVRALRHDTECTPQLLTEMNILSSVFTPAELCIIVQALKPLLQHLDSYREPVMPALRDDELDSDEEELPWEEGEVGESSDEMVEE
ncbi:hypothetical protein HK104_008621 [Borealophlyctis nickersoniae]|nr:hypothetical protein HK104_008621 [Borealophlyctis nickersoniae]